MNEQTNVQIVKDAYAAFARRDIKAILAALTDTIDWQFFGPDELPMAGRRRNKQEVSRFFEQVEESWIFDRFEPRDFIAQGETVIVLGAYNGKSKPTGKPFTSEWAHAFTLSTGKIAKFREYADTQNMVGAYTGATARV